ncbi:MAG: winged helix-turn-helix transcriptional regulator, partial [Pseudomonadota bacterium]
AIQNDGEFAVLRRRWTVPILAMTRDPQRFSALRSGLAPISDRALAAALQQLEAQNWVSRTIDASRRHPYPLYTAINRGREINAAIGMAA